MPRYLLHLSIALILSTLAGFVVAQQDEGIAFWGEILGGQGY